VNDDSYQTEILEVVQSATNYRKWLAQLTFPYLGKNPVEIGSGLGDYALEWLDLGAEHLTLSESSSGRLALLLKRFDSNSNVLVEQLEMERLGEFGPEKFSCVVSLNVIEHISDDRVAFASAFRALEPGGYVVAFAPASPMLMSKFDRDVGHCRRYTKRSARALLEGAGFTRVKVTYVNSLGWLAWFLGMKVCRLRPSDGLILRAWDRLIIPIMRMIEGWVSPPFGQSVLIVGQKVTNVNAISVNGNSEMLLP